MLQRKRFQIKVAEMRQVYAQTLFPINRVVLKESRGKKQTKIITFTNLFFYLFTDN
jgi:hypothetical protein